MKKLALLLALAIALLAVPQVPAYADASPTGCLHSSGKAAGCSNSVNASDPVSVPEPNSFALLAAGLAALAGLALLLPRKQLVHS